MKNAIKKTDPLLYDFLEEERKYQFEKIRLIPSENYVSEAIMEMSGSILTNRYTEGYIGNRYYEGQEVIDKIEGVAIERATKLFKMKYANVQALSGGPANLAIHFATLSIGDKTMGLHLTDGGHLTHGWKVNFSGKLFNSVHYRVHPETHYLDYDAIRELALKEKPKLIIAGYSSYPRAIDFKKFSEIAKEVGALLLADISHISGLIIAGMHPDPSPYADIIMTTTHKSLRGPKGAIILSNDKQLAKKIDQAVFPMLQGGSHNQQVAGKAICFKEASNPDFQKYGQQVHRNCQVLSRKLKEYGFKLITDGTDIHLILIDMRNKNLSGKEAASLLNQNNIICNQNSIPYDPKGALNPSGIRIGTPAITTRGMEEKEMEQIATWIHKIIEYRSSESKLKIIKNEIATFSQSFPMFKSTSSS